ncbi:MAG: zinc-ribbon domain-containing protein [Acidobacteriota bacterium]
MFCPQCGTESTSGQQYCRSCGANLKVIGKAVSLSEAIARSDRGPLPKIKEMMKSLKIEQVSDEISSALDKMNQEIVRNSGTLPPKSPSQFEMSVEKHFGKHRESKEKTAQQRREKHIVQGLISLFSGAGLMIFLYYLSSSLILKLPEHIVAQAPFEIDPVVRIIWLVGLIPALTGLGRILAGLTIRSEPTPLVEFRPTEDLKSETSNLQATNELPPRYEPASVTERTTNILNRR